MMTASIPTAIDDLNAVNEAVRAGRPIDSDFAQREEERAEAARNRRIASQGIQDTAFNLVRQSREERY